MNVGLPLPGSDESATITVDGEDVTARLRGSAVEEAVSWSPVTLPSARRWSGSSVR
jgi:hypothetical protein